MGLMVGVVVSAKFAWGLRTQKYLLYLHEGVLVGVVIVFL